MPNYLISYSDHKVVLRNYEGYITTYEEPVQYTPHDKANCQLLPAPALRSRARAGSPGCSRAIACGSSRPTSSRRTVAATSPPHRLQDPSKWVPYGVGPIEGTAGQPLLGLEPGPNGSYAGGRGTSGARERRVESRRGAVPETSDAASAAAAGAPREPKFEYGPGEEPRPAEGEPTGWSHGELL